MSFYTQSFYKLDFSASLDYYVNHMDIGENLKECSVSVGAGTRTNPRSTSAVASGCREKSAGDASLVVVSDRSQGRITVAYKN